ncbi:MAG: energy-coupling factor ABC transporter permease [Candidatus Geothermincolia bacterium]
MHIPDGFLNAGTGLATGAVSLGAVGYGLRRVRHELDERRIPLLALTAAFIFAAQMLNFPVAGGTSGHFLGALLAVALLGPWAGCVVMALVVLVQCLGFADGGITALGGNIFNMAIVGGLGGYALLAALRALLPKTRKGMLVAAAVAAWFSVMLASAAAAMELAVSGLAPLRVVLPAMLGVHSLIGIGEAVITSAVLGVVLAARPDLVAVFSRSRMQAEAA